MSFSGNDITTRQQLDALGYLEETISHHRPLLICDVDEVVLYLVDPFKKVLAEQGFVLKSNSFKLTGNIYERETGREATQEEIWQGLNQLFSEQAERQGLVDGAVEGLNALGEDLDIVFLTNLPHQFGAIRRDYLAQNGLRFPLITNSGSKVPAMEAIFAKSTDPVGFIDDTPRNLEQVRDGLPDIHLFHFVANEDFRKLAGDVDGVRFAAGCWHETAPKIRDILVNPAPAVEAGKPA